MPTDLKISQTILQQLGGFKFISMTGAKNFVAINDGLTFRIPTSNKINAIIIHLNGKDLYDVEFNYIRGAKMTKQVKEFDVSNDKLQEIFTLHAGLFTHL